MIIIYHTLPPNNNDNSSLINCTNNIRNLLINNLLLNIDKTKIIDITKNLTQNEFPIYLIDNVHVETSKSVTCLGFIIDVHLL